MNHEKYSYKSRITDIYDLKDYTKLIDETCDLLLVKKKQVVVKFGYESQFNDNVNKIIDEFGEEFLNNHIDKNENNEFIGFLSVLVAITAILCSSTSDPWMIIILMIILVVILGAIIYKDISNYIEVQKKIRIKWLKEQVKSSMGGQING